MERRLLFVLLFLQTVTMSAFAETYLGIEGTGFYLDSGELDEISSTGGRLKLGVQLSEHLDLEAQLGGGTDSNTQSFDRFSTVYAGVYTKLYTPFGRRSALFVSMGLASIEHTQTINDAQFSDSRASFAYGFGLETMLSERVDLTADYMRYSSDEGIFDDMTAISIGLKWYL